MTGNVLQRFVRFQFGKLPSHVAYSVVTQVCPLPLV